MNWTRDEKSLLLYLETCAVDHGGMVEAQRMNRKDFDSVADMEAVELLSFGRILSAHRPQIGRSRYTHWVELTDAAWAKAHELRKERGLRNVMNPEFRTESQRMTREDDE